MKHLAIRSLVFCSALALAVTACGDDGSDPEPPDAGGGRPDAAEAPDATPIDVDAAPLPPLALVLSTSAVSANEGDATGASVTVKLNRAPGQTVTVAVASSDEAAATAAPASLTFDDATFGTDQTLTVTGVNDADGNNETVTLTLSATGLDDATVEVSVIDDDSLNIVVDPTTLTIDEGGTATVSVSLTIAPPADVTVNVASSDEGAATAAPASLTFTPANYADPQTVTVTAGTDDDIADASATITLSATGLADATVTVSVNDTTQPYATDMFVRITSDPPGDHQLVYQGDGLYELVLSRGVEVINFQISDTGAPAVNRFAIRDANGGTPITAGTPTTLVRTANANAQILLINTMPNTYRFTLDATDPEAPILTVTLVP
jgi:hypothetical protein